jgi:hypothetical protein
LEESKLLREEHKIKRAIQKKMEEEGDKEPAASTDAAAETPSRKRKRRWDSGPGDATPASTSSTTTTSNTSMPDSNGNDWHAPKAGSSLMKDSWGDTSQATPTKKRSRWDETPTPSMGVCKQHYQCDRATLSKMIFGWLAGWLID